MESLWRILTLTAGLQLSVAVGLLLAVGYVIYRSAQGVRSLALSDPRRQPVIAYGLATRVWQRETRVYVTDEQ